MRQWSCALLGALAIVGLFLPGAGLHAETCTLELKKIDAAGRPDPVDLTFRYCLPQTFVHYIQGASQIVTPRLGSPGDGDKPDFSKAIAREPASYHCESPLRGVAQLGSKYYGFVLDTAAEETPREDDAAPARTTRTTPRINVYSRLHFDFNHNGDLTDDEVIEATSTRTASTTFPTVDIQLDFDGETVDYAFRMVVSSRRSGSVAYATASLYAAAYREGEIQLDGAKHRVVLVDVNSNGRFDDPPAVNERYRRSDGVIYTLVGDMLYIDPRVSRRSYYDARSSEDQFYTGSVIRFDNRFLNVEIRSGGKVLALEPSKTPTGFVSNPNKGFRAFVYGDLGMLELADDDKSGKAELPVGEWKLLSYTIDRTGLGDEPTVLDVLFSALPSPPNRSVASARATSDCSPVKVAEGKTVEMPFGPPYRLEVGSRAVPAKNSISLSMKLVGAAGETCSSLSVNGGRPPQPEFTISTTGGEEVAAGKFKYG